MRKKCPKPLGKLLTVGVMTTIRPETLPDIQTYEIKDWSRPSSLGFIRMAPVSSTWPM